MLASLEAKSEASAAKRLRFARVLNAQGRLLHFYGLGLAVAANGADRELFHFETTLLSQVRSPAFLSLLSRSLTASVSALRRRSTRSMTATSRRTRSSGSWTITWRSPRS